MTIDVTQLRGQLRLQESMSLYTSWRVGGPADRFYIPADAADLAVFLAQLPATETIVWLGLGSNSLVRDSGIRGTVIATQKAFNQITQLDEHSMRVEAGVSCATFARFCARLGMSGAEFWAGIPGTMGGALMMNAGCHGGATWDAVTKLEVVNRQGEMLQRQPAEYQVGYRKVVSPQASEWFIAAEFSFPLTDKATCLTKIRQLLAHRAATQPTNEPNAGSVFRNPANDYAARLIEACGLKGLQLGGAAISTKHANFIINTGTATAADIENLISLVQEKVRLQQGIELIREVHIFGDK